MIPENRGDPFPTACRLCRFLEVTGDAGGALPSNAQFAHYRARPGRPAEDAAAPPGGRGAPDDADASWWSRGISFLGDGGGDGGGSAALVLTTLRHPVGWLRLDAARESVTRSGLLVQIPTC